MKNNYGDDQRHDPCEHDEQEPKNRSPVAINVSDQHEREEKDVLYRLAERGGNRFTNRKSENGHRCTDQDCGDIHFGSFNARMARAAPLNVLS